MHSTRLPPVNNHRTPTHHHAQDAAQVGVHLQKKAHALQRMMQEVEQSRQSSETSVGSRFLVGLAVCKGSAEGVKQVNVRCCTLCKQRGRGGHHRSRSGGETHPPVGGGFLECRLRDGRLAPLAHAPYDGGFDGGVYNKKSTLVGIYSLDNNFLFRSL